MAICPYDLIFPEYKNNVFWPDGDGREKVKRAPENIGLIVLSQVMRSCVFTGNVMEI